MTKNARRLTDTPEDEKKPGTNGHRADSKPNHTEKNSASEAKKEAVPSRPIEWPESEADRRVATRKWHATAIRNVTGSPLRGAAIVDDQLLPGTSSIFRTDEFLAAEFGGTKRSIERNFADLENAGFVRIRAIWGGDGRRARIIGRHITLCVPVSVADALNDKNVEQCDNSVEPDDKNVGPNDRNVETYNIDLRKKTSRKRPSEKDRYAGKPARDDSDSVLSHDELSLIEEEAVTSADIEEATTEPNIKDERHAFYHLRSKVAAKVGIQKSSPKWNAFCAAFAAAHARADECVATYRAEREKKEEALRAAKHLTPADHFRSWKATWNEPRLVGNTGMSYEFWAIGDDVGLSREQLERKSRRQAADDFERYSESWAISFGSDRPIRPFWKDLPEPMRNEAIEFVEEKNRRLLDDGFDEVA